MSQFPIDKNVFEESGDKQGLDSLANRSVQVSEVLASMDRSRSVSPFEVPPGEQGMVIPDALNLKDQLSNDEQEDLAEATSRNPTAVLELDMDCNVRFLSQNWESIVGTKIKKIINHPVSEIVVLETDFDKNVFSRALQIMTADDLSYRVKFITYTNFSWAAESQKSEQQAEYDEPPVELERRSSRDSDGVASVQSAISTDGGLIEMEGQGILIHDLKTHLPTHSMWILRPFIPFDVTLELPTTLVEKLGSGIDIFESYLLSLNDAGIIDMDAVPAPRHVLCRICEQQVPAWWLERHSEICLVEHKLEDQVRACHESLIEHKKLIMSLMEGIAHTAPSSPGIQIGSPLGSNSGSSPNTSSSTISSLSSASSTSSTSSPSSHSRHKSPLQYKGLSLPYPKPASSSAPTTSSPLSSNASSTVSTPVSIRKRSSSIFGSMRFPLKNLERLVQYCTEALSINPGEVITKTDQKILDVAYSPNSEKSMKYILNTTLPVSTDPAVRLLTEDTEALARDKVDAIERLASSLQYSEKLKREIDQLVLQSVTSAVEKIREHTTSFDHATEESTDKYQTEDIFTAAYHDTDNIPETPSASAARSIPSPIPNTPGLVEPIPRSQTPKIQIAETQTPEMQTQTQTPDMANDTRGRRSVFQQHRTVYLSPRRPISPAPAYFFNSPMASLQRNTTRRHRDSGVSSSTPTSSPLLTPNDLPVPSALQRMANHSSSISTWDSGLSERHSSTDSASKMPLSPLLVSNSVSSKQVTPSIKDYEIIKPISKGAFGSVYLTRRRLTGEYFAIKVLKKSDMIAKNQVPNVKAERAIMMRQSDSPYVAQLYSSFQSKDYLFLVMEYLNGGDAASLLKMLGTLSADWAKRYIAEVIVGVDDLHQKGIVHRDLKPDNLLIDNQGHLKLTDFGLSRMGLVGRQKNVRRESVADSNSIFDALQQNSGSGTSIISRNHKRTASITPFSLSPNLERASLSIPTKVHQDTTSISPSSPPTPSSFEHLIRSEGVRRSSSNASSTDSPLIRPLMTRTSSQTSFAILDDIDSPLSLMDSVKNPYALFDPQTSTQARKFVGTPDYLAPETIEGVGQDEVSDWWSIGCILFEFLFGYPPFHVSTAEKVFENILTGDIDWPKMSEKEFNDTCSPTAKDLIEKLLVKDPTKRLGFNGTEEIKSHPFFEGICWDTLFNEEASFLPLNDDPESTDYFDSRGADQASFPLITDDPDLGDEDEETDYEHDISDSLDFSNATKTTSPALLEYNRNDNVNLLGIHISERERRGSKLSESNSTEFGSFQFRNLAALDRANKDQINRLKNEHVEHRGSFSSSTSSVEGAPLRSRGYSTSGSLSKRQGSSSAVATPSRSSFGSGSPNLYKLGYSLTGSISGDENNSTLIQNDSSGRNSPLQNNQQSRSTDSGSPIPRILKQNARSSSGQSIGQQLSPQYPVFKALGQPFQDFSPSSSDNEESRNSAILRVRKRRSTRRLGSESTENSESIRRSLITYDVLLCEPIPILRESTKIMLQQLGCAVVAIKDGDELIRRATGEIKFDFIVTALKTPKINAVDVVKLIKNTATVNSDTPIITITAYYKEAKMSGVFDYVLEKPINAQLLADVLNRLSLQKRKITQEAVSDTEGL